MHTSIRWWVAPPTTDESLSSMVRRAADLYEIDASSAWRQLHGDETPISEVDDPSPASLQLLAHALDTTPVALHRHRIEDAPMQLAPAMRQGYCPLCRQREAEAGQAATQQRSWASVLRTFCPEHGVPLLMDFLDNRLHRHHYGIVPPPLTQLDRDVLDLIDGFALALEGSLFDGRPWPEGWRGDGVSARGLLLKVSFNTEDRPLPLAIANLAASPALAPYVHAPRHLAEPVRKADWEAFRRIADPALRRAALWVVAWRCVPGLRDELCPGWLDPVWDV